MLIQIHPAHQFTTIFSLLLEAQMNQEHLDEHYRPELSIAKTKLLFHAAQWTWRRVVVVEHKKVR